MLIDSIMTADGPSVYYDPAFRVILEDHITYLRNSADTKAIMIEPAYAYKYEGDLFGLLSIYNIPFELHWVVMRMNKMVSPTETTDLLSSLLIPNKTAVERIRNVYMTKDRVVH